MEASSVRWKDEKYSNFSSYLFITISLYDDNTGGANLSTNGADVRQRN